MEEMSDLKFYTIVTLLIIGAAIITAGVLYLGYCGLVAFNDSILRYKMDIPVTKNTSIASLTDGSSVSGSFFLGTGSVSNKMYFVYYEGESAYKLKRVPAERTTIFMDENEHPYITEVRYNELWQNNRGDTKIEEPMWHFPDYEFHVPNGSIVRAYVLDANVN